MRPFTIGDLLKKATYDSIFHNYSATELTATAVKAKNGDFLFFLTVSRIESIWANNAAQVSPLDIDIVSQKGMRGDILRKSPLHTTSAGTLFGHDEMPSDNRSNGWIQQIYIPPGFQKGNRSYSIRIF